MHGFCRRKLRFPNAVNTGSSIQYARFPFGHSGSVGLVAVTSRSLGTTTLPTNVIFSGIFRHWASRRCSTSQHRLLARGGKIVHHDRCSAGFDRVCHSCPDGGEGVVEQKERKGQGSRPRADRATVGASHPLEENDQDIPGLLVRKS